MECIVSKAQESQIARRYATAFYELAAENKKTDAIAKDMKSMAEIMMAPVMAEFVKNPLVARNAQIQAIATISKKAKLNALTRNFLGVVAENGRLPILGSIVTAVQDEISVRSGEVKAEITSARPLTTAQSKAIQQKLEKMTGADIEMSFKEDASILGGLIVKVGSLMIDQSVKNRLNRLEQALKSSGIAKDAEPMRNVA